MRGTSDRSIGREIPYPAAGLLKSHKFAKFFPTIGKRQKSRFGCSQQYRATTSTRSIISRTFADTFKLQRSQLVAERKSLGLNYGGVFLFPEVMQCGSSRQRIVVQLIRISAQAGCSHCLGPG